MKFQVGLKNQPVKTVLGVKNMNNLVSQEDLVIVRRNKGESNERINNGFSRQLGRSF